jgi:AcrR family transcriptional regulator
MVTISERREPGRRERSKAACRARIIQAAIRLFGEGSIDSVTVDDIAAAADVGKGTIYNYFRTKEHIVVAFMADFERKVLERLRALELERRPLVDTLTEFLRLQFMLKAPYHHFVRVFFGQMFLHTDSFLPHMAEIHAMTFATTETLFATLQQRGVVRSDLSAKDMTNVFGNVQLGLTALWAIEGPPFRMTEDVLRREVELFCEGLEARHR